MQQSKLKFGKNIHRCLWFIIYDIYLLEFNSQLCQLFHQNCLGIIIFDWQRHANINKDSDSYIATPDIATSSEERGAPFSNQAQTSEKGRGKKISTEISPVK